MAVGDVFQVQLWQTYAGQQVMNALSFRWLQALDPTNAQIQSLANDWKTAFATFQTSGLSYTRWIAQQLKGGDVSYVTDPCNRVGGLRYEGLFTGSVVGGGTADGLPPQSALVITLKTPKAGRTHRGRVYLPGIPESVQTNGTIVAGNLASFQTTITAQLVKFGVTGTDPNWQLGVWSMRTATGCVPSKTPPFGLVNQDASNPSQAFEGVTELVCKGTVYSQRKRTIGVGI